MTLPAPDTEDEERTDPLPSPADPYTGDTEEIPRTPGNVPEGTIPAQLSMPGTSEAMRSVEGVYTPSGDEPD